MRRLKAWLVRFRGLFGKTRRDREFQQELESNLEMHIADNMRSGMTAKEARRNALIRIGGVESTKQQYRERRGLPAIETLMRDVTYALRSLRSSPGFTVITVLMLALGIGANTAIFTIVNAVMIERLPFHDSDRLVV